MTVNRTICANHPDREGSWFDANTFLCRECEAKTLITNDASSRYARQPGMCLNHPRVPGRYVVVDGKWLCDVCHVVATESVLNASLLSLDATSRHWVGVFVHHALDHLWYASPDSAPEGYQPTHGEDQDSEHLGCCPECCAPCHAMYSLLAAGELDIWVRQWPEDLDCSWWDATNDRVDRGFLTRAWANSDQLGCHS